MDLSRRTFIKLAGAAGAATVAARPARAEAAAPAPLDTPAVLVDTTLCAGCRGCEAACSEANALAAPAMAGQDAVFDKPRTTSTGSDQRLPDMRLQATYGTTGLNFQVVTGLAGEARRVAHAVRGRLHALYAQ